MSTKDRRELRRYMSENLGRTPEERAYFTALDRDLAANDVWSTTTTTTSSTTTTTSSTSSTTTSTSSTTTTTTA